MIKKPEKSAIFIAVRMKSTRLPRKALLEIQGRTVIEHLIDRLKTAAEPAVVVLCTSTNPDDAVLVDIAVRNGIEGFQGSEDDKLDRFLGAADKFGVDFIAAVDGDDIFCDAVYIDKTIRTLDSTGADMVNCDKLPLGTASNGIKVEALRKVCRIKLESDTEVWGGYFTDTGLFKVESIEPEDADLNRPDIRLTLDYQEDFELFKRIFTGLYRPGSVFSLKEIVDYINLNPQLLELNKKVHQQYLEGVQNKGKKIRWRGDREQQ